MTRLPRLLGAVAALALTLGLAACGSGGDTASSGTTPTATSTVTQTNAWGTATIPANPQKVAVVSGGDRSIAYALGIKPVIEWSYPDGGEPAPYLVAARQKLGITEPVVYDGTDGTDFAAIAAADPDVILAVNSYSMDDDYEQLVKIAPVITFTDPAQSSAMTWQERITRAADGLGIPDKAKEVIAANEKVADDARAANPGFAGATYTYLVVHPEQLSYMSYEKADKTPLDDLGLVRPANAAKFNGDNNKVSLENLDAVDADVVLIDYPFGAEGLLSRSELESNPLWTKIPAVAAGRWGIVDSESGLASDMAYPDALSYPWVVEQVVPIVSDALAGKGGA